MMHQQQGLALPTVMALSLMGSVMLLAEWRGLTLAEGFGQNASQRWALQQTTQAALLRAVQDIQGPLTDSRHQAGSSKATQVFFPNSTKTWTTLQTRLGTNDCLAGICKPLGGDSHSFTPWLSRLSQAQTQVVSSSTSVHYWVEVLPLQTKWATTASPFVYRITALAQSQRPSAVVGVQALWHPTPTHAASNAVPMPLSGFIRLLSLSP
jgi:Tfp pilus assembly protein PilX